MPIAKNEELEKKTLNLRKGDWDFLEGALRNKEFGPSILIRRLVSGYVDKIRAREDKIMERDE